MPDKAKAAEPQAPGPHVTLADLEAQAAELAAERDALASAHTDAVARVKQLEDNLQAYGGAQQAVERMIAKAKEQTAGATALPDREENPDGSAVRL